MVTDAENVRSAVLAADADAPYWMALRNVTGIGPVRFGRLLAAFGSIRAAWGATVAELGQVLDRRSLGAQTEDQSIELHGLRVLNEAVNNKNIGSVSITSFNRRVLLSGQADSEQTRRLAEEQVRQRVPNIQDIYNEVEVAPAPEPTRLAPQPA